MSGPSVPAFPCGSFDHSNGTFVEPHYYGMSERTYIATRIMAAIVGDNRGHATNIAAELAQRSVFFADALLKELEK